MDENAEQAIAAGITQRMIAQDTEKLNVGGVDILPDFMAWTFRLSVEGLSGEITSLIRKGRDPMFGSLQVGQMAPFDLDLGYLRLQGMAEVKALDVKSDRAGETVVQEERVVIGFKADHDAFKVHFGEGSESET